MKWPGKLTAANRTMLASLVIRIGLALAFLYAGIAALRTPEAWIGYLPGFVSHIMPLRTMLDILSVMQIALAAWLLTGQYTQYAAALAALMLGGIVVANPGAFIVTFRDVSLLLAAVAVVILDWKREGS